MKLIILVLLATFLTTCSNPNCGDVEVISSFPHDNIAARCRNPRAVPHVSDTGWFTCVCNDK